MNETNIVQANLKDISPDNIIRNPDNPRLFFRGEEMDTLMSSIKRYGVQVPITVYPDGKKFVLIDGERRWRCVVKLNLKSIPALVQSKPSKLKNLLLMYNIHALREQWDYFTIASKLPDLISMFREEYLKEPNDTELSERTGLTKSQIHRCKFLLDLPKKYKDMLKSELTLPKQQQQLSEDFFIEMERALKTIATRIPSAIPNANNVRDAFIKKFRKGIIKNVTDFRRLSKIATSVKSLGVEQSKAQRALKAIFNPDNNVSIEEVFSEQFELRYDENRIIRNIESISEYLENVTTSAGAPQLSDGAISVLKKLKKLIERVLKS
jgi:ParB/RepB/Spo0J family partition protein